MSRKPESTQLEAEMVSLCKYPDHDDVQVILGMRGGGGGLYIHNLYCSVVPLTSCHLFER